MHVCFPILYILKKIIFVGNIKMLQRFKFVKSTFCDIIEIGIEPGIEHMSLR